MRIAITTKDGVTVNEHFGKAKEFYIYDIADGALKAIEKREVTPYCASAEGETLNPNHEFSIDKFGVVYDAIKDCNVLYTQQIGDTPKEKLKEMGVMVQLCSCKVESLIGCNGKCK